MTYQKQIEIIASIVKNRPDNCLDAVEYTSKVASEFNKTWVEVAADINKIVESK